MSRAAKVVVAVVLLALLGAGAFASLQYFRKSGQTISAHVLPGIAQPGPDVASSEEARGVVIATVDPVREGEPVLLQAQAGGGWQPLAVAEQDSRGRVELVLPDADSRTYRLLSPGDDDLEEAVLRVPSDAWGPADFADEFDRDAIGPDWINRGEDYNVEGLRACSKGSGEAAAIGGGTLQLSVIIDPERAGEKCRARNGAGKLIGEYDYRLNGHVTPKGKSFKYGVLAARIKFQKARGQHASLWMQPAISESETDSATGGAEIDVIEWFGDGLANGGLTSFIYARTPQGQQKVGDWIEDPDRFLSGRDDSWFGAYHVFSVEWTPNEYVFRIDGRETWRTSEGISHQPEYPILSLLSSDYELRLLPKSARLPQTMHVDWVKYWES